MLRLHPHLHVDCLKSLFFVLPYTSLIGLSAGTWKLLKCRHRMWMCCADAQSGKILGDQFIGEGAGGQGEERAGAGSSTPGPGRDQQEAAGLSAFQTLSAFNLPVCPLLPYAPSLPRAHPPQNSPLVQMYPSSPPLPCLPSARSASRNRGLVSMIQR